MNIETKFNIGDEVWIMKDNKPFSFKINQISVNITTNQNYHNPLDIQIKYSKEHVIDWIYEGKCFATKEELKQAIFGE